MEEGFKNFIGIIVIIGFLIAFGTAFKNGDLKPASAGSVQVKGDSENAGTSVVYGGSNVSYNAPASYAGSYQYGYGGYPGQQALPGTTLKPATMQSCANVSSSSWVNGYCVVQNINQVACTNIGGAYSPAQPSCPAAGVAVCSTAPICTVSWIRSY